jgi:hypothetical protein
MLLWERQEWCSAAARQLPTGSAEASALNETTDVLSCADLKMFTHGAEIINRASATPNACVWGGGGRGSDVRCGACI